MVSLFSNGGSRRQRAEQETGPDGRKEVVRMSGHGGPVSPKSVGKVSHTRTNIRLYEGEALKGARQLAQLIDVCACVLLGYGNSVPCNLTALFPA